MGLHVIDQSASVDMCHVSSQYFARLDRALRIGYMLRFFHTFLNIVSFLACSFEYRREMTGKKIVSPKTFSVF